MGKKVNNDNIHSLDVEGWVINNQLFLSIAENINVNNTHSNTKRHTISNSSLQFMSQIFKTPYPNLSV
jgi:SLT domain-containing protein